NGVTPKLTVNRNFLMRLAVPLPSCVGFSGFSVITLPNSIMVYPVNGFCAEVCHAPLTAFRTYLSPRLPMLREAFPAYRRRFLIAPKQASQRQHRPVIAGQQDRRRSPEASALSFRGFRGSRLFAPTP